MQLIVVRGASGVVTWSRTVQEAHKWTWVCGRDSFVVAGPDTPALAEAAAVAIVQHSAGLVGAVSQVVQLDL